MVARDYVAVCGIWWSLSRLDRGDPRLSVSTSLAAVSPTEETEAGRAELAWQMCTVVPGRYSRP
jgi:hypothetical protein